MSWGALQYLLPLVLMLPLKQILALMQLNALQPFCPGTFNYRTMHTDTNLSRSTVCPRSTVQPERTGSDSDTRERKPDP